MKWLKGGAVVFGVLALTVLGIDASDTWQGNGTTLLGQLMATKQEVCPVGMIVVPGALSYTCADQYEASAGDACQYKTPANTIESGRNLAKESCQPQSVQAAAPWSYLTREQAQLACVRAGKRLPGAAEWHQLALGAPDDTRCVIAGSSPSPTGSHVDCRSASGAFDVVGNVWEWVRDDVTGGVYQDRTVPPAGYVQSAASDGVAVDTGSEPSELYGDDYFWSSQTGVRAMMRGGFYGSDTDAGVYAVHADTDLNLSGVAIGFRCVQ